MIACRAAALGVDAGPARHSDERLRGDGSFASYQQCQPCSSHAISVQKGTLKYFGLRKGISQLVGQSELILALKKTSVGVRFSEIMIFS